MSGEATEAASSGGSAAAAVATESAAAAEQLKEQGNEQHRCGNHLKAAALYTQGLKADPTNAVLFSNRCAALLKLSKTTKALADAEECIRLRPDWDKGYFRKGAVLEALEKMDEALESYQAAYQRNKESKQLAEKVRVLQKVVRSKATATQR
ncbi:Small glutamine-rich tetratricopeptide repeat-containing protein beta [Chlorella vulgaris]